MGVIERVRDNDLDVLFPSLAVWLLDKLEALRHSRLRWLGTCLVIKVRRR